MPTPPLRSASIRFNSSVTGAAIYAAGGQLSVDRAEINNNRSSGSGGAIVVSDIKPPTPASITRSYFHDNSAGVNGGALYALDGSTLNLSASTFTRDRASGLGGGVYVDTLSNLNVLNSTFLGGVNREGIVVASGLGNVVFSTIVAANLGVGSTPTTHLSNSILREVTCAAIVDEGLNLQFQSTGCPVSVPARIPFWIVDFLRTMAVRRPRSLCFPAVRQSMPSPSVIAWIRTTSRLKPTSAASAVLTRQTQVIAISGRTSSEPRPESRSEPAGQPCGARDWRPHRALGYCGSRRVRAVQPATRGLKSAEQFNAFNPHYIPTANRGPKKDAQRSTVVRSVGMGGSGIA